MERIHIEAACLLGFYASYWRLVPLTYILTMFAGPFRRSRPTTNGITCSVGHEALACSDDLIGTREGGQANPHVSWPERIG